MCLYINMQIQYIIYIYISSPKRHPHRYLLKGPSFLCLGSLFWDVKKKPPMVHASRYRFDVSPIKNGGFSSQIHPGRLTWNLQITQVERKIIFQTSMRTCSMLIFRGVCSFTTGFCSHINSFFAGLSSSPSHRAVSGPFFETESGG